MKDFTKVFTPNTPIYGGIMHLVLVHVGVSEDWEYVKYFTTPVG